MIKIPWSALAVLLAVIAAFPACAADKDSFELPELSGPPVFQTPIRWPTQGATASLTKAIRAANACILLDMAKGLKTKSYAREAGRRSLVWMLSAYKMGGWPPPRSLGQIEKVFDSYFERAMAVSKRFELKQLNVSYDLYCKEVYPALSQLYLASKGGTNL